MELSNESHLVTEHVLSSAV